MSQLSSELLGGEISLPQLTDFPPEMLRHVINYTSNTKLHPQNMLVASQYYYYSKINTGVTCKKVYISTHPTHSLLTSVNDMIIPQVQWGFNFHPIVNLAFCMPHRLI